MLNTFDKSDIEFSTRNKTDKWPLGLVKLMISYESRYALDLLASNSFDLGTIQHWKTKIFTHDYYNMQISLNN